MDVIDDLVANNRAFAASLPAQHLDVRPRRQLAIVTCMDSRLDVFAALGLKDGEAHVLRNAGGVITDDVIRSLAVGSFVSTSTSRLCRLQNSNEPDYVSEKIYNALSEGVVPSMFCRFDWI